MLVTVTAISPDRRAAKPADLVALDATLTTAQAQGWIDAAGTEITSVLGFAPWRQSVTYRLPGSGSTVLQLPGRPIQQSPLPTVTDIDGGSITDFTIGSNSRGLANSLLRDSGWDKTFQATLGTSAESWAESESDAWIVSCVQGWIMPGQLADWAASSAYGLNQSVSYDDARGSWVRASDRTVAVLFECTTAGTSGGSEPTWDTTAGNTTTDGTVTWTARDAVAWPAGAEQAALQMALWLSERAGEDIASEAVEGLKFTYRDRGGRPPVSLISSLKAAA